MLIFKVPNHFFFCLALSFLITGCTHFISPQPEQPAVLVSPDAYPHFYDDMFFDVLGESITQSILYYNKFPDDRVFTFAGTPVTIKRLRETLFQFQAFIDTRPSTAALNRFIRNTFDVYKSTGRETTGDVLFTGYYEPSLKGRLTRDERFKYPIFATPDDLVTIDLSLFTERDLPFRYITGRCVGNGTVIPYYERKEIGSGEPLFDHADVLAWVDDRVDLFFLEIQGSGIINLGNGSNMRVHYHSKNGRAYKSIGSYLLNQGHIPREEMSMQRIKQYLEENPEEVSDVLNYNTSYVFFTEEQGGPYGCYAAAVTPERSIATDKGLFPPCGLAFIQTEKPLVDGNGNIHSWIKFSRFVLNQDTGGAIKGPGRVDLFMGNGSYAEIAAGHMQQTGSLYFLVLKDETPDDDT